MEKKNTGLVGLVIVLSVLVVGLCGYIVYDKVLSNNANNNNSGDINTGNTSSSGNVSSNDNSSNNNSNNSGTSLNSNWIDYLLSVHLLDAKISRNRSKDLGDNVDFNKTVTISREDLQKLLEKLNNVKLSKTYSIGRGGPERDKLTVSYEYNDKVYKFEICNGTIIVELLDNNFKELLNNNNYEEKNTQYKGMEGSFYYYSIDNYSDNFFDMYF